MAHADGFGHVPDGARSSPEESQVNVLAVKVQFDSVRGLWGPEYRVGDLSKSLLYKISSKDPVFNLVVMASLVNVDSRPATVKLRQVGGEGPFQNESLLLHVPTAPESVGGSNLCLEVRHSIGLRGAFRSDPLIGTGQIEWRLGMHNELHEVDLLRGNQHHGVLVVKVSVERRVRRTLLLGKKTLINLDSVPGGKPTHWGLALKLDHDAAEVYEVLIAEPTLTTHMAVLGPRGIIAAAVPHDKWESWKQRVASKRRATGRLPEALSERVGKNEPVLDEDLVHIVSRSIEDFNISQDTVGETLRNDIEIESFICDWVQQNVNYGWTCNCQDFCRDFHQFLSCGDSLDRYTVGDVLRTASATAVVAPVAKATAAIGLTIGTGGAAAAAAAGAAAVAAAGAVAHTPQQLWTQRDRTVWTRSSTTSATSTGHEAMGGYATKSNQASDGRLSEYDKVVCERSTDGQKTARAKLAAARARLATVRGLHADGHSEATQQTQNQARATRPCSVPAFARPSAGMFERLFEK